MARNFDQVSSEKINLSIGGLTAVNPLTILAVINKSSDSLGPGGGQSCLFAGTAAAAHWAFSTTPKVAVFWGNGGSNSSQIAPTLTASADGWYLIGASKASGTVTTRFYLYSFSSRSWSFENGSTTTINIGAPSASAAIGTNDASTDYMDGDIAIAGVWNVVLSDADVQKLAPTLDPNDWLTLPAVAPVALWRLNQSVAAGVTDLTGNGASQSSVVGTRPSLDPAISVIRSPVYLPFPPRY